MKNLTVLLFLGFSFSIYATPLNEPFSYSPGANLIGQTSPDGVTWVLAGAASGLTNQPTIVSGNLTYPGLGTPLGNSVKFGGNSAVAARFSLKSAQASGTIYYSFVM